MDDSKRINNLRATPTLVGQQHLKSRMDQRKSRGMGGVWEHRPVHRGATSLHWSTQTRGHCGTCLKERSQIPMSERIQAHSAHGTRYKTASKRASEGGRGGREKQRVQKENPRAQFRDGTRKHKGRERGKAFD